MTAALSNLRRNLAEPLPTVDNCLVVGLMNILDCLLDEFVPKEGEFDQPRRADLTGKQSTRATYYSSSTKLSTQRPQRANNPHTHTQKSNNQTPLPSCSLPLQGVEPASKERVDGLRANLPDLFVFALVWSVMITSDAAGRRWWDSFLRTELAQNGTTCGLLAKAEGLIFDYCFDIKVSASSVARRTAVGGRACRGGGVSIAQ